MNTVFTIGHSTRAIDEFIDLLKKNKIKQLIDIRSIPGSRHNPQYGQQALEESLKQAGIDYIYIKELGGLRKSSQGELNDGWHNKSFRNYADYMQTEEFAEGLQQLLGLAKKEIVAIMCAEALPWRCHRSLVSDALLAHNVPVCEIIDQKNIREHKLTSFAVIEGKKITYPKSAISEKV